MSNRKNYNSIVFLTVYLGLILVGATPQVLAQAAMTRQFDIVTEIEFKDDLDKKPDDEQEITDYSSVLNDLYPFVADVANRETINNKDYEHNPVVNISAKSDKALERDGKNKSFWGDVLSPSNKTKKDFSFSFGNDERQIDVILSTNNFFAKTNVHQHYDEHAGQFGYFYRPAESKLKLEQINNAKAFIYQNTFLPFENNQVFTVTRLPRASIDSYIAQNA